MLTAEQRIVARILNRLRFSEGAELDKKMKTLFGLTRLEGESDENFLDRADEIIFGGD